MSAVTLRRWSYRVSALLGAVYVGYVLVSKWQQRPTGGVLGELGEFGLVLACVTAFGIGLFADEALRRPPASSTRDPHT